MINLVLRTADVVDETSNSSFVDILFWIITGLCVLLALVYIIASTCESWGIHPRKKKKVKCKITYKNAKTNIKQVNSGNNVTQYVGSNNSSVVICDNRIWVNGKEITNDVKNKTLEKSKESKSDKNKITLDDLDNKITL